MLIEKLRKRQKEIIAEMRAMQNKTVEEKRQLNEAESATFASLESECESVQVSIEREERLVSREARTGGSFETPAPAESRNANGSGEENEDEERSSKGAGAGKGEQSTKRKGPFSSLGEQLQAVIRSAMPGNHVDKRLMEVRAPTGMSESVPADGGFLVQQDYITELSTGAYETGVLSSRCRRIPIGAGKNGVKLTVLDEASRANGSRLGGIQAYWVGEGEQKPKSFPKLAQMELQLKKLVGLIPITDELLEDATALEAWVKMLFMEEFGFQLDQAIIAGTGVGQPLGILNSPALVTQADEAMQAATELQWLNIVKMYSRLLPSSISKAVWLYNSELFPLLSTMTFDADTTNPQLPIFTPANGNQQFNSLLGVPLIPIEQAKAPGTVGDLLLADLSKYLLIEKGGVQTAMSIHVRFDYDESMLRFVLRVDGQPLLRSAITPFNGSLTKSAFVALDTRNGS